MEISARVAGAGRASALGIERVVGEFVNATAQLQIPARGKGAAALRDLSRDDAIEHVHAAMHGFEDIERRADAHEVAWTICRQKLRGEFAHVLALVLGLAHGQPADREPIERHRAKSFGALAAEVLEARPARWRTSTAANRRAPRDCALPTTA